MTRFIPYGRQSIEQSDIDAVVAALHDPLITQGPRIDQFERRFADTVGARHAVAFSSGTGALHAAAAAAGIEPGDEVLTTPVSFVASANCVLFVGGRPVFADIDPETANIDLKALAAQELIGRLRACVVVSLAGLPVDLEPLREARARGMVVIEDACHALGAIRRGSPVGADGADMTAFSLHPVKAITSGEGGVVVTDNADLDQRLRTFRTHGIRRDSNDDPMRGGWHYEIDDLGFNYRITDFQCALGQSQLSRLPRFIEQRNQVAGWYRERLADVPGVSLPAQAGPGDRHAYHLFVVRFPEGPGRRRFVYDSLLGAGIGTQVHYIPIPAHSMYQRLGYSMVGLPNAQAYWEQALTLPIFPGMALSDVERVASEVSRCVSQALV